MTKPTKPSPVLRKKSGNGYRYGFCCKQEHGTFVSEGDLERMGSLPMVLCGACSGMMRPCGHAEHLRGKPGSAFIAGRARPVQTVRQALERFGIRWYDDDEAH